MNSAAFFSLHRGLPRQGPGEAADIVWLGQQIALSEGARIADLACGPGADIQALLGLAKATTVTATDRQPHFIEEAQLIWGRDSRVHLLCGDMRKPEGRFDLIWCAGAVYNHGVTEALENWRNALTTGGVIAFSEPCFWQAEPPRDVHGIWLEYPAMSDAKGIDQRVRSAGFETIASRPLLPSAWENYYRPLEPRIKQLRANAGPELMYVLDEAQAEISTWREYNDQFGYLLNVVRPA